MRKLLLCFAILIAVPAFAELTVEDTHSPLFLRNHGYSNSFIETVQKTEAASNGEAYKGPVEKEYYNNTVVKYVRNFFKYFDPAMDDQSFWSGHDIKPTANVNDL